jgi:hypothetical protein
VDARQVPGPGRRHQARRVQPPRQRHEPGRQGAWGRAAPGATARARPGDNPSERPRRDGRIGSRAISRSRTGSRRGGGIRVAPKRDRDRRGDAGASATTLPGTFLDTARASSVAIDPEQILPPPIRSFPTHVERLSNVAFPTHVTIPSSIRSSSARWAG